MTTAIKYRMGAGFAGDVNRMHPASIEPCLIDSTAPPTAYGQPVVINTNNGGVRPIAATGDNTLDAIYGITVRPYPTQQSTTSTAFGAVALGAATPPTTGVIDVLRSGYIMVYTPITTTVTKGARVFVWCSASSGSHVLSSFEAVTCSLGGAKTFELDEHSYFNGVPDSSGIVELAFAQ